jgi:hypothetical protein
VSGRYRGKAKGTPNSKPTVPFLETRGMRAFFEVCGEQGVHPENVHELRREKSARFHERWSDRMRELARAEGAWKDYYDTRITAGVAPRKGKQDEQDDDDDLLD